MAVVCLSGGDCWLNNIIKRRTVGDGPTGLRLECGRNLPSILPEEEWALPLGLNGPGPGGASPASFFLLYLVTSFASLFRSFLSHLRMRDNSSGCLIPGKNNTMSLLNPKQFNQKQLDL